MPDDHFTQRECAQQLREVAASVYCCSSPTILGSVADAGARRQKTQAGPGMWYAVLGVVAADYAPRHGERQWPVEAYHVPYIWIRWIDFLKDIHVRAQLRLNRMPA